MGTLTEVFESSHEAIELARQANEIVVIDQASYELAGSQLKNLMAWFKRLDAVAEEWVGEKYKEYKTRRKEADTILAPPQKAIEKLKGGLCWFMAEEERKRREHQRQLEEEARKQGEAAKLEAAVEAEDEGVPDEIVNQILDAPMPIAPVVAPVTYDKVQGIGTRETWSARVTDLRALARAFAEGHPGLPPDALQPNMAALNRLARTMKSALSIPGLVAEKEDGVTVRTR